MQEAAIQEKQEAVKSLLRKAKVLAVQYYALTGKPLGVTGEVAELVAAELLDLTLADARTAYYDAVRERDGSLDRIQIKGRAVLSADRYRGRMPAVKCGGEFESVMLVLLDRHSFDALEIWEATKAKVTERLDAPGSKSRNERRSMGISQFRSIATCVWRAEPARVENPAPRVKYQTVGAAGNRVGSYITRLLADPILSYSDIVDQVKREFPAAKTSPKSVATTARDLRRRGIIIPARQQPPRRDSP